MTDNLEFDRDTVHRDAVTILRREVDRLRLELQHTAAANRELRAIIQAARSRRRIELDAETCMRLKLPRVC